MPNPSALPTLLRIVARLRSPTGCPWDREQDHRSIRLHAIEEVYELIDAIEAGDDHEMVEELGDLLLQVVFHCQLAKERGAFDFEQVCQHIVDKLIRRHPHVFGDKALHTAEAVLTQWEHLKRAEKVGTRHERPSALDGIPRRLPALMRAHELMKKARRAKVLPNGPPARPRLTKVALAKELFDLAAEAQRRGWSAEALLRTEVKKRERALRRAERQAAGVKGNQRSREFPPNEPSRP
jgi:MazG family protein